MIIAIDGPAGAGKGTLSQNLALKYKFRYLDTGTLFRAVALCVLNDSSVTEDNFEIKSIFFAKNLDFKFTSDFKIMLEGQDVSDKLRTPEVGRIAAKVAAIPAVRTSLDDFQKKFTQKYYSKGAILDGRDIGTFIAPQAELKIYLDCPPEIRAKRKIEQFKESNIQAEYDVILKDIIARDKQDAERQVRPLKPAKDAIIIDTYKHDIQDVVNMVSKYIDGIKIN